MFETLGNRHAVPKIIKVMTKHVKSSVYISNDFEIPPAYLIEQLSLLKVSVGQRTASKNKKSKR